MMHDTIFDRIERGKRAERYIRHVSRVRYRRRMLVLQWLAASFLVAWAVVVAAFIWAF